MTNYSVYPNNLDGYATLPLVRDGIDEITAASVNRLRDAIVKIEQELGVQPSGTYATVSARLTYIGDLRSALDDHLSNTTDAHDASAISVQDTNNNYLNNANVEEVLNEIASLIPSNLNEMGEDNGAAPNGCIPSLYDGYGPTFVYNVNSPAAVHRAIQPYYLTGLHILEVSGSTDAGIDGYLRMSGTLGTEQLAWMAPGDPTFGESVSIASLTEGEFVTLESYTTTKRISVARTSGDLPALPGGELIEQFEVYTPYFIHGYFSLPSEGFKLTERLTRTSYSFNGDSRYQFIISGKIQPADKGTLVLQRKTRGVDGEPDGSAGFSPIATLSLSSVFDEDNRSTGQNVYIPSMTGLDVITLFDRYPINRYYELKQSGAEGQPHEDFDADFPKLQIANYMIPISNPGSGFGTLTSPNSASESDINESVSGYRIFHYKDGFTDFTGDPTEEEVYGIIDTSHPSDQHDTNNVIRYSNIYVDDNSLRPGIGILNLIPLSDDASVSKTISGVKYYNSSSDLFGIAMRSDSNAFRKTYVLEDILTFETNVFNFPNGFTAGKWGASVDIQEILDDGYAKLSNSNLPGFDDLAYYIVNDSINSARRIYPAPNSFSNHSWIEATMHDPFGAGDGYIAYGTGDINRILVNSYSTSRATNAIEYFTDESKRISDTMVFDTAVDGYSLTAFDGSAVLAYNSLQVGGKFGDGEFDYAGLIYPQEDYYNLRYRIRPFQQVNAGMDYSSLTGHRQYQRLFSLGYPISSGRLRIVSSGNYPVSFEDIRFNNLDRFGKIEIRIPGHGTNSAEWLDIGRLFSTGDYEDGYGALYGEVTGSAGDLYIPFTFGIRNTFDDHGYSIKYAIAVRVTYFGETEVQRNRSKNKVITMIQLLP